MLLGSAPNIIITDWTANFKLLTTSEKRVT